ncbi:MAG: serine/threonine protein kinase [Myxococcales bacterium]|nr:serine/threonine protein kinase [Myxococcales bacterium]
MREEQFGRYVLLERLGYGGMAEVFVARTQSIGGFEKLLAIKRLLPFCTEDEQTVELLADEAKITVRLTHPNIVQVFDFGRVKQSYYIAMEFVDGLDLKSLVQIDELTSEPLPIDVALLVAISILDALDFAHNRADEHGETLGIIHRDVSPHNVLISRHGQVKLTDFGVARARISSHVSIVGDIRGKFSYMPPEQACGGEIDQRVDVFAAGAILYELLAGKQPYRSASSGEQMALLNQKLVPPSALVDDIPPELDAITVKALEKDPANRFDSAKAFANALRDQLERYYPSDPLGPQQALARLVERRLREDEEHHHIDGDAEGPKMTLADYSAREDSVIWGQAHVAEAVASTDEVPQQNQHGRPTLELPPAVGDIINSAARDGPTLNELDDIVARAPAVLTDDPAFMATQLAIPAPRDRERERDRERNDRDRERDRGRERKRSRERELDPADAGTDLDIAPIKKAPTTLDEHEHEHDDRTLVQIIRHEDMMASSVPDAVRVSEGVALVAANTALELSPPTHDTYDDSKPMVHVSTPNAGSSRRDAPTRVQLPATTDAEHAIIDRPPRDDAYDPSRGDALSRARKEISQHLSFEPAPASSGREERSDRDRRSDNGVGRTMLGVGGASVGASLGASADGAAVTAKTAPTSAGSNNGAGVRPRANNISDLTDPNVSLDPPPMVPAGRPPGINSRYVTLGVLIAVALVGVVLAIVLATSGTSDNGGSGSGTHVTGVGTATGSGGAAAVEAGAATRAPGADAGSASTSRDASVTTAAAPDARAPVKAPNTKKDRGTVIRIIKLPVRPERNPRRGHGRHGWLTVNAFPWGRVEIDGRKTKRVTPMQRYRIRTGRHRVRVYYVETKRYSRWLRVFVRAGHEKRVMFKQR